ncbi:hypothetical protein HPB51_021932 [Rhipicephalus microplus]|uniref:SNF2 N-terminal domain-containing protein n=1 Tax=Rhipicephalus microplus TaxID=6941 RepID=A0A9J6EQ50_RHIMP|nr:hypothetical protein HPB51_021932 [Rhipicephalus microplus]
MPLVYEHEPGGLMEWLLRKGHESLVKQMTKENGVLVTSYACVSKMSGLLLKHEWHYVILDEGHKIRNPDAQTTLACKQVREDVLGKLFVGLKTLTIKEEN